MALKSVDSRFRGNDGWGIAQSFDATKCRGYAPRRRRLLRVAEATQDRFANPLTVIPAKAGSAFISAKPNIQGFIAT